MWRPVAQVDTPCHPLMDQWRGCFRILPPSSVTAPQHPLSISAKLQVDLLKGQDHWAWGEELSWLRALALWPQSPHLQNGMVKALPQTVFPQHGDGATLLSRLLPPPPPRQSFQHSPLSLGQTIKSVVPANRTVIFWGSERPPLTSS